MPDAPAGGVPTWFERDGRRAGPVFATPMPPVSYPQISPDGTRLAVIVGRSLWVYPLDGRPPVRLTSGDSLSPLWSPDGQSIVYERYGAVAGLHAIAADGSSSVPRAVGPPGHFHAHGFTRRRARSCSPSSNRPGLSGRGRSCRCRGPAPRRLRASATSCCQRRPPVRRSPRMAVGWRTSPTPRAAPNCGCDATRRSTAAVRISPNGAAEPVWAKDGRELFYLEGDKLMSVRVGPDTRGALCVQGAGDAVGEVVHARGATAVVRCGGRWPAADAGAGAGRTVGAHRGDRQLAGSRRQPDLTVVATPVVARYPLTLSKTCSVTLDSSRDCR